MAVGRRWNQVKVICPPPNESSSKVLGQLLLILPSLAVVGYLLGALIVALQAANSGLPILAIVDGQSTSQLLATGFIALSPGAIIIFAAAAALIAMFGDKIRPTSSSRPSASLTIQPYGVWKRIVRLMFSLLVVAGLIFGPIAVPLGILLMVLAAIWLLTSALTRTSWSVVDLLTTGLVYLLIAGVGYGFILTATTERDWPVAKLTAGKTNREFGYVGTNSGVATLISCRPNEDGFSEDAEVRYVPVEAITVSDESFRLNPRYSENLLSLLTTWTKGRENDRKTPAVLC